MKGIRTVMLLTFLRASRRVAWGRIMESMASLWDIIIASYVWLIYGADL